MSLIERALGKAKESTAAAGQVASAIQPILRRPSLRVPEPRSVLDPELRFTEEIRERLGLMPSDNPEHQRASEYRHIKRQLVAEIRANPERRVVVVASALSGEGKSFTAANLATSLALEPDYTVLLVDADVVKPQLSRAMGLVGRPGLMNALAEPGTDIDSLIVSTDIEGLSVLPAGSASENATEYFGSEHMLELLEHLQSVPNRIVLIDSLPLLLTTEARALMPLASQVLLVVRAESTPQSAVKQALSLIDEGANVKLVLNAAVRTRVSRYLGYGYGFDYNYSTRT